jgi:LytS/YehU family sensor histidine kinase
MALSRGLCGSALAILGAVATAVAATSLGHGPFVSNNTLASIWQIEAFIAIITTSGLLIGAGSDAQRREKALQAVAATRKAELERLKAQVNPHFLFNCLTAIHSLIRTDSGAAEEGLTSLSSLLRKSLDVAKHPLIPLAEELEIIRDALRLQKMRYEEGLEWSVAADKAAEEFRVPPMLLQPLVENAVKHGVSDGFGRVDLSAVVQDGDLIVKVRNTAPEGSDPAKWQDSVGLASVRARIEEACPPGSGVEFTKTPDRWIQALVRIKRVG